MEPNKTYPLHPDQDDQTSTPRTPPVNTNDDSTLPSPSSFDSPQSTIPPTPQSVPWYLQPLTKTSQSPLTSSQTRPFVPRAPLPVRPQDQPVARPARPSEPELTTPKVVGQQTSVEPSLSPFRSQPLPPLRSPHAGLSDKNSIYRPPPDKQEKSAPQPLAPVAVGVPKPFSQFGSMATPVPMTAAPEIKPKKRRRIISAALMLLLVGLIGGGVYVLWQKSRSDSSSVVTPAATNQATEERFYVAIEKHLQTSYVRQQYSQTTEGSDTEGITLDVTSDFSNPANPKSHIRYSLHSRSGDTDVKGAGEIIILDKSMYFGNLSQPVVFYQGDEAKKPKVNQWYQISSTDNVGNTLMDPLSVRSSVNSSVGEIPVGNFSEQTRRELIQLIRDNNVYAIKSSNDETEEGKKLTRYNVDFNATQVNVLNKRIIEIIGENSKDAVVEFENDDVKNMEIWVDNESGRIAKIKFDRDYVGAEEQAAMVKEKITITLGYPNDSAIIKVPENATSGSWDDAR